MARNGLSVGGGIIDGNYTGNIFIVLHNVGNTEQRVAAKTAIAQLLIHEAKIPETVILPGIGELVRMLKVIIDL